MLRTRKTKFTAREYLAMEEVAAFKSEYYRGEIYALSRGSLDHSLIQGNLIRELGVLLADTPCRVLTSEIRVHVESADLYTYPDAAVVCGRVQFLNRRNDTILNPLLIVEVLSPTTRDYDRGAKFEMYKGMPGLQEYVLVDAEKEHVECYLRSQDRWAVKTYDGRQSTCRLESVDCEIPLTRIYQKVTWLD